MRDKSTVDRATRSRINEAQVAVRQLAVRQLVDIARRASNQIPGISDFRVLPGPRVLAVAPLTFDRGRLCLGGIFNDDFDRWNSYEECWDFPSIAHAWAAMVNWSDDVEPEGWERHLPPKSHAWVRRPGGDASKEYVSP